MSTGLRLTVAQYDRMVQQGAFDELPQKIELIRGEIQGMNPSGPVHDDVIDYLMDWSVQNTDRNEIRIRIQNGLSLPELDSRPEPDILWVKQKNYREAHPGADDVLLAIEVSVTSLSRDRDEKATLYAQAGIPEYWVVNPQDEVVYVFRDPDPGGYQSLQTLGKSETPSPLIQQDVKLNIGEMFGG